MWISGTSDNYIELLNKLREILTSDHLDTAVVAAAGTGYSVDDVLTVSGGTSSTAAKIEVLTVGGSGEVLTSRIMEGGAYTVNPSSPVSVTGGTGGDDATFTSTFDDSGWTVDRESQEGATVAVNAAGTGYTQNDTLVPTGGTGDVLTAMSINVDTVGGSGEVLTVSFNTLGRGSYSQTTPGTTAVAVTGGTGGDTCTLDFTYQNSNTSGDILDKLLILEGEGSGSEDITIGIRTFNVAAFSGGGKTCYNWSLNGMSSYNAGLSYDNQPGVAPQESTPPSSSGGSYIPLKSTDAFDMEFWFNITKSRIICAIKCEDAVVTHYMSSYQGLMNRSGTVTEFPYPIYVSGCTSRYDTHFSDQSIRISGIVDMVGVSGKEGPGFFRRTDEVWEEVKNSNGTDSGSEARTAHTNAVVYPAGNTLLVPTGLPVIDQIIGSGDLEWSNVIPPTGVPGVPDYTMKRAIGGSNFLIPATVLAGLSGYIEIEGELDQVFWTSAADGESSEDRISEGADRYMMFQNGFRSAQYTFMAIKEGDG